MSPRRLRARRLAGPLLAALVAAAGAEAAVLHVAAGAAPGGDGSAAAPIAGLAEALARSAAGDRLVVHGDALAGGIELKPGQTLIGAPAEAGAQGPRPRITGGGPIVLAEGCEVVGLEIAARGAAALVGAGVGGVRLTDVHVAGAGGRAAIELSGDIGVELVRVTVERVPGAGILGVALTGRLALAESAILGAAAGGLALTAAGPFELSMAASRIADAGAGAGDRHGVSLTAGDGAEVTVAIAGSTIERAAGSGIAVAAAGAGATVRFSLADSVVASSGGHGLALVAGGGEEPARIDFELRDNLAARGRGVTGSRSSAISVQADGSAAIAGIIAATTIEGAELGRGIEVLADDASRVVVALDGTEVSRTELQGIYADAQDDARLDLTLTGNRLAAPRAGSYGLEISVRERAEACLAARGNHSAAPPGGSGLRARQRDGSTLRVEGATAAAVEAVDESLEGGNAGTSVVLAAAEGLEAVPEGTCLLP